MAKTKTSTTGILSRRNISYGFTLVELIVVITVISVFLVVALPNFRWAGMFQNRDQGVAVLVELIENLKGRAVLKNVDIFLNVDTATGLAWITDAAMDETAAQDARENPLDIPGDLMISAVEFPGEESGRHPDRQTIRFSRNGYSDLAILHVQGASTPVSLKIEPFLETITPVFEQISFHDCR